MSGKTVYDNYHGQPLGIAWENSILGTIEKKALAERLQSSLTNKDLAIAIIDELGIEAAYSIGHCLTTLVSRDERS